VELDPPAKGFVVRLATFPPDSAVDKEQYAASIDSLHGADANVEDEEAMGMHFTDTVETLLRTGDTIINRGNKHAWSNRTNAPATVVATMFPASR
jgi:hypothetical protein